MPNNNLKDDNNASSNSCGLCGTEPLSVPCSECIAELQTIERVESMVIPPSVYDAEFWSDTK